MTSSVFVHDIQAPAPLEEFFLPLRNEVRGMAGLAALSPSGTRDGFEATLRVHCRLRSR